MAAEAAIWFRRKANVGKKPLFINDMQDIAAEQIVEQGVYDIGGELRQARRRKGVDLITAARDLKIRDDYLKALEQNDHGSLPGLPYAAGFVRSYAIYVGLDADDLVRRFKGETKKLEVRTEYTWLTPIQEGRFSGGIVFILSLFLAGGAYAGWYYQTKDERKPAVAADAVSKQDAAPIVAAAAGAAREVPKAARQSQDDARKEAARKAGVGDSAVADPGRAGTEGGAGGEARADTGSGKKKPPAATLDAGGDPLAVGVGEGDKPAQQAAAVDNAITLKALGYVWMRVRNPQTRRVVAERTMKKGAILKLPKNKTLVLDVGRSNLIEIMIGNRSAGLAGKTAGPKHNISLDPARLKQGG